MTKVRADTIEELAKKLEGVDNSSSSRPSRNGTPR